MNNVIACIPLYFILCYLNSVEAYTMQISGVNSYIHGNHELIAFADIRRFVCLLSCSIYLSTLLFPTLVYRCIIKKEIIHLSVLDKPSPLMYEPFDISVSFLLR